MDGLVVDGLKLVVDGHLVYTVFVVVNGLVMDGGLLLMGASWEIWHN